MQHPEIAYFDETLCESFSSNIGLQTRHDNTVTQWPHFVPHDERLPYRKDLLLAFDNAASFKLSLVLNAAVC
jgi:hypothetical protein